MISLFSILTPAAYCAAIYFGAKYYNYDIDGFLLQRSYDFIFILGYIQILVQNSDLYKNVIKHYKATTSSFRNEIDIVLNNKIVRSIKKASLNDNNPELFDLIVYKCENDVSSKTDIVFYQSIPENFAYNVCKYTFIQIILTFFVDGSDHTYKINLHNDADNYYIVNNRLNATVLSYLLFKIHRVSHDLRTVPYSLNIMDQNVRSLVLNEKDEIILHETCYEMITVVHDDDDEDEDDSTASFDENLRDE